MKVGRSIRTHETMQHTGSKSNFGTPEFKNSLADCQANCLVLQFATPERGGEGCCPQGGGSSTYGTG